MRIGYNRHVSLSSQVMSRRLLSLVTALVVGWWSLIWQSKVETAHNPAIVLGGQSPFVEEEDVVDVTVGGRPVA